MGTTVQARLDDETTAALKVIARRNGWSASQAVREAIKLLTRQSEPGKPAQIIGLGKYDSGIIDLGSNKKHLEGYGKRRSPMLNYKKKR